MTQPSEAWLTDPDTKEANPVPQAALLLLTQYVKNHDGSQFTSDQWVKKGSRQRQAT